MITKDHITEKLTSTGRPDIQKLVEFLDESDFYTAPCSRGHHLAIKGGLALHTKNVLDIALEINGDYGYPIPVESVIIASICHDLCKVNYYKETSEKPTTAQMNYLSDLMRLHGIKLLPAPLTKLYATDLIGALKTHKKGDPLPAKRQAYEVEDELPLGHGEKSLYVASTLIKLRTKEALAIRWHMSGFDAGMHIDYNTKNAYNAAQKVTKLVSLLSIADMEATFLVEAE